MESFLLPTPLHFLAAWSLVTWLAWCRRAAWLHRWRAAWLLMTVWIWLASTTAIGNLFYVHLESEAKAAAAKAIPKADGDALIVVLASGQLRGPGGRPAPRLDEHGWERLQGGVELWRRVGGRLLFTGGPADEPSRSLAALMSQRAVEMGVPPQAIVRSGALSENTYEDLLLALPQIRERTGAKWLVTSALHMPRALDTAASLGLQFNAYPVDFRQIEDLRWRAWLPDARGHERLAEGLHEMLGLAWYRLRHH